MATASFDDARMRLLRSLRRRRFERFRNRGADALVARIPEDAPLPAAVQERLAKRSDVRIYPVPGGFIYKWPHYVGGRRPKGSQWRLADGTISTATRAREPSTREGRHGLRYAARPCRFARIAIGAAQLANVKLPHSYLTSKD